MTDKPTLRAPWTAEQIDALNRFQTEGGMHPFTCGRNHETHRVLIATYLGWICPDIGCDYRQDWAHPFMAQPDAWPKPFRFTAATEAEPTDPMKCSGEEGFCPEYGFHRHSLKQPDRRQALAFNAVGPVINTAGYWLPLSARRAVADAVLAAVTDPDGGYCPDCGRGDAGPTADEYETARRRAVTLVERIDAARTWARQHLTADQTEQLYAVLRGDQPTNDEEGPK